MANVTAEGEGHPFEQGRSYTAFGDAAPALRNFALWLPGTQSKRIGLFGVIPGGPSIDLTPTADLNPDDTPDGELNVYLQGGDASATDKFDYRVSHSILNVSGARRYQMRDVGCGDQNGECVQTIPAEVLGGHHGSLFPPLLALVGFKLQFIGDRERELQRVVVRLEGHELHVVMRDQSVDFDDTYSYLVEFVVIPSLAGNPSITRHTSDGLAEGIDHFVHGTPPDTDFVITGWELEFLNGDHEINAIGVDRRPDYGDDQFQVLYSDSNADDPFRWRVDWAHVGRTLGGGTVFGAQ
jgi:hypothetical protein